MPELRLTVFLLFLLKAPQALSSSLAPTVYDVSSFCRSRVKSDVMMCVHSSSEESNQFFFEKAA